MLLDRGIILIIDSMNYTIILYQITSKKYTTDIYKETSPYMHNQPCPGITVAHFMCGISLNILLLCKFNVIIVIMELFLAILNNRHYK
jgi:hypothetical protein